MAERTDEMSEKNNSVYAIVLTGVFTALVMAATSFFKIPVAATNGYVHVGDAMIFLAVMILGRRNGTIAGATGSALADLIGGYAHWVPWTFVIKGLMAFAAGTILFAGEDKSSDSRPVQALSLRSVVALTVGGLVMISGYFMAQRFIYGTWAAPLAALPGNIIQAGAGILISEAVSAALGKSAPQLFAR